VTPLAETFERGDMGFAIALLRFYARLFLRWAYVFNRSFLVGSAPSPLSLPTTSRQLTPYRLFFGTKVVNTELHKALPALATDVNLLCVKALQVPRKRLLLADWRNSTIIFKFNRQYLIFMMY